MTAEKTELKEYTSDEVSKHTNEDDCWMIIGNEMNGGAKVYDVTRYLDDHPGGAEVMLDVSGQNADEFFEDIGHSSDARNELKKYLIGTYKMSAEEIEALRIQAENKANKGGASPFMILFVVIVAVIYALTQKFA